MKIRTFLFSNLIALFIIFDLGCSKDNLVNGAYISLGDSVTIVPFDSIRIYPYVSCDLTLSKKQFESGDTVKILFAIYPSTATDVGTMSPSELIFSNQEKLGIKIYKDSSLIYNYPKEIVENNPDTVALPAFFHYNWNQIDNDSNQVHIGKYIIKCFLLHEYYSRFIKQKEFSIYK